MNNNRRSGSGFYIFILAIILIAMYLSSSILNKGSKVYTYQDFSKDLADQKIASVEISQNVEVPTGRVTVILKDETVRQFYVTDVTEIEGIVREANLPYSVGNVLKPGWFVTYMLPVMVSVLLIFVMMTFFTGGIGGANSRNTMNFGKNRAQMVNPKMLGITFESVAGLKEEKEDLAEIVDFLRDPQKYVRIGARIPKGVILVGPPGTGKTLLAKAVAGEAGVPFFTISGSDFVEMFVGVGASRVRDLFEDAKRNAPCIIFIDEIDAVARQRGTGLGGSHDEREQTLNQLLGEKDGFGTNSGIIEMAATNRVDILDPAILRPGRFDRRVSVGYPDVGGRQEILEVHSKNKPLGDDVDLKQVAQTTAGFSGADLENLMNEAALGAVREGRSFIRMADVTKALIKVGIGTEKKSRVVSEKDRRITAYHESGHAILFHVLPDVGPVHTVSIIPTGVGAAGYTMPLPERDEMFNTRGRMLQEIIVNLGGRVAEELVFEDVTTGASQDIKNATKLARDMVTRYGFSADLGLINYDISADEVFIGREIGHTRSYSEQVAAKIDEEVKAIVDHCYETARALISENIQVLHASARLLMERERITGEEFAELFGEQGPAEPEQTDEI
ncbi:MAG: ATP-dependent zinc metalloprotease FtsH [Lachnospiraceae bacterium]|nr:ATP-dependent zinc metalloprotease FtsH [Lachnospiraceae bacterium]